MEVKYKGFWEFVKFLHEHNYLNHVVLVGSWAEYIYQQAGLLGDFKTSLRTLDIDFLIRNKMIPKEKNNLCKDAKNSGVLVRQDFLTNCSKIYMTEENLEIEFLIQKKGRGDESVLETNLGVNAQALRNLEILTSSIIKVNVFNFDIIIPTPEAYVIHKMIINNERKDKNEKDTMSINTLLNYINKNKFLDLYYGLSKKSQIKVKSFMEEKAKDKKSQFHEMFEHK